MARKPRTTITAIAQCGKELLLLGCCMVADWEDDEYEVDAVDATDATDAVEREERVDCTERVEREDCDMVEATESAYVVSEWWKSVREVGIGHIDRTYAVRKR